MPVWVQAGVLLFWFVILCSLQDACMSASWSLTWVCHSLQLARCLYECKLESYLGLSFSAACKMPVWVQVGVLLGFVILCSLQDACMSASWILSCFLSFSAACKMPVWVQVGFSVVFCHSLQLARCLYEYNLDSQLFFCHPLQLARCLYECNCKLDSQSGLSLSGNFSSVKMNTRSILFTCENAWGSGVSSQPKLVAEMLNYTCQCHYVQSYCSILWLNMWKCVCDCVWMCIHMNSKFNYLCFICPVSWYHHIMVMLKIKKSVNRMTDTIAACDCLNFTAILTAKVNTFLLFGLT